MKLGRRGDEKYRQEKKIFILHNKKGDEKYYLIISLILGLMVVGLAFYFIFQEYFNDELINDEACRQSVIMRSGNFANGIKFLQEKFPFKCKTDVVEIDGNSQQEVLKKISDAISSCYFLYGEGKFVLYSADVTSLNTACFICSRLVFSDRVKKEYPQLDVGNYLISNAFKGSQTYFDYLYNVDNNGPITQENKRRVLSSSLFNTLDGDLLITYLYYKPNVVVRDKLSAGVIFFQPNVKANALKLCSVVETIPA